MIHKLKISIILLLISCSISAQKFIYNIDFLTFFDNRESHIPSYSPKTLFGIQLSPQIGIQINDSTHGKHQLLAGISYTQPFGSTWKNIKINPTIYYNYKQHGINLSLGFIPWNKTITSLPDHLISDSLRYLSPNIQGALFAYTSKKGYAQLICDWRGMQSPSTREAFRIILSGEYQQKYFAIGANSQLNHLANRQHNHDGVCDDIILQPYFTTNLTPLTPQLDTLALRTSYIFSYQRDRKNNILHLNHGFLAELSIKWRFLQLNNTTYIGNPIYPLYEQYGALLNQGEPLYQHPIYNKTKLAIHILQKKIINIQLSWNIHYIPNNPLAHQQILTAQLNI